jgi:hypothetical protein
MGALGKYKNFRITKMPGDSAEQISKHIQKLYSALVDQASFEQIPIVGKMYEKTVKQFFNTSSVQKLFLIEPPKEMHIDIYDAESMKRIIRLDWDSLYIKDLMGYVRSEQYLVHLYDPIDRIPLRFATGKYTFKKSVGNIFHPLRSLSFNDKNEPIKINPLIQNNFQNVREKEIRNNPEFKAALYLRNVSDDNIDLVLNNLCPLEGDLCHNSRKEIYAALNSLYYNIKQDFSNVYLREISKTFVEFMICSYQWRVTEKLYKSELSNQNPSFDDWLHSWNAMWPTFWGNQLQPKSYLGIYRSLKGKLGALSSNIGNSGSPYTENYFDTIYDQILTKIQKNDKKWCSDLELDPHLKAKIITLDHKPKSGDPDRMIEIEETLNSIHEIGIKGTFLQKIKHNHVLDSFIEHLDEASKAKFGKNDLQCFINPFPSENKSSFTEINYKAANLQELINNYQDLPKYTKLIDLYKGVVCFIKSQIDLITRLAHPISNKFFDSKNNPIQNMYLFIQHFCEELIKQKLNELTHYIHFASAMKLLASLQHFTNYVIQTNDLYTSRKTVCSSVKNDLINTKKFQDFQTTFAFWDEIAKWPKITPPHRIEKTTPIYHKAQDQALFQTEFFAKLWSNCSALNRLAELECDVMIDKIKTQMANCLSETELTKLIQQFNTLDIILIQKFNQKSGDLQNKYYNLKIQCSQLFDLIKRPNYASTNWIPNFLIRKTNSNFGPASIAHWVNRFWNSELKVAKYIAQIKKDQIPQIDPGVLSQWYRHSITPVLKNSPPDLNNSCSDHFKEEIELTTLFNPLDLPFLCKRIVPIKKGGKLKLGETEELKKDKIKLVTITANPELVAPDKIRQYFYDNNSLSMKTINDFWNAHLTSFRKVQAKVPEIFNVTNNSVKKIFESFKAIVLNDRDLIAHKSLDNPRILNRVDPESENSAVWGLMKKANQSITYFEEIATKLKSIDNKTERDHFEFKFHSSTLEIDFNDDICSQYWVMEYKKEKDTKIANHLYIITLFYYREKGIKYNKSSPRNGFILSFRVHRASNSVFWDLAEKEFANKNFTDSAGLIKYKLLENNSKASRTTEEVISVLGTQFDFLNSFSLDSPNSIKMMQEILTFLSGKARTTSEKEYLQARSKIYYTSHRKAERENKLAKLLEELNKWQKDTPEANKIQNKITKLKENLNSTDEANENDKIKEDYEDLRSAFLGEISGPKGSKLSRGEFLNWFNDHFGSYNNFEFLAGLISPTRYQLQANGSIIALQTWTPPIIQVLPTYPTDWTLGLDLGVREPVSIHWRLNKNPNCEVWDSTVVGGTKICPYSHNLKLDQEKVDLCPNFANESCPSARFQKIHEAMQGENDKNNKDAGKIIAKAKNFAEIRSVLQQKTEKSLKENRVVGLKTQKQLLQLKNHQNQINTTAAHFIAKSVISIASKYASEILQTEPAKIFPCHTEIQLEDLKNYQSRKTSNGRNFKRTIYENNQWLRGKVANYLADKACQKKFKIQFKNPAYTSQDCSECKIQGSHEFILKYNSKDIKNPFLMLKPPINWILKPPINWNEINDEDWIMPSPAISKSRKQGFIAKILNKSSSTSLIQITETEWICIISASSGTIFRCTNEKCYRNNQIIGRDINAANNLARYNPFWNLLQKLRLYTKDPHYGKVKGLLTAFKIDLEMCEQFNEKYRENFQLNDKSGEMDRKFWKPGYYYESFLEICKIENQWKIMCQILKNIFTNFSELKIIFSEEFPDSAEKLQAWKTDLLMCFDKTIDFLSKEEEDGKLKKIPPLKKSSNPQPSLPINIQSKLSPKSKVSEILHKSLLEIKKIIEEKDGRLTQWLKDLEIPNMNPDFLGAEIWNIFKNSIEHVCTDGKPIEKQAILSDMRSVDEKNHYGVFKNQMTYAIIDKLWKDLEEG